MQPQLTATLPPGAQKHPCAKQTQTMRPVFPDFLEHLPPRRPIKQSNPTSRPDTQVSTLNSPHLTSHIEHLTSLATPNPFP